MLWVDCSYCRRRIADTERNLKFRLHSTRGVEKSEERYKQWRALQTIGGFRVQNDQKTTNNQYCWSGMFIPDLGSGSASKNSSIFNPKINTKFSKNILPGMFIMDPGSWIWTFFNPGSRIQGSKSTRSGSATLPITLCNSFKSHLCGCPGSKLPKGNGMPLAISVKRS